jgi:hypothetical protein
VRKAFAIGFICCLPLALSGCGSPAPTVDLNKVLARTFETFVKFDTYMQAYDYKSMSPQLFEQLSVWMNQAINEKPALHDKPIVTIFNRDASLVGHLDLNRNGQVDPKEPLVFKVEVDADNFRLIASGPGKGGLEYQPPPGFVTGVLIGSMLIHQRSAGIRHGHFDKRKVRTSTFNPEAAALAGSKKGKGRKGKGKRKRKGNS